MEIIYHANIREEHIKIVREVAGDYILEEYKDQDVLPEEAVLFLVGEERPNMMRTVQQINKKNPEVSLLIFPTIPSSNNHLKMALQFSPFVNQHVKILETLQKDSVKNRIRSEAELTVKRKKYKKTVQSVSKSVSIFKADSLLKATVLDNFLLQAPIGVMVLDKNNIILDINKKAQSLVGEGNEAVSKHFHNVFKYKKQTISKLLNNDTNPDEDVIVKTHPNGKRSKYVKLNFAKVVTANAEYKMVMAQDITGEILAEQKVRNYLHELEKHNKELEQFAKVVSHDLKNPLSTITMSCELAEEVPPEEKTRYISIIQKSANNLLQMIQGLEEMIDLSRNKKQKTAKCNFQQIFDEVINEYQYQIKTYGIQMTCDFKPAPSVNYVKSYLVSIFHNMINNAIKYRKENEPLRIHISTSRRSFYTLLKFSDNGIGIDLPKYKKSMFQPFKRFTKQATGKGIGLSIIKSMVEKNNGKIEVESTPGVGTSFLCFLRPYEEAE